MLGCENLSFWDHREGTDKANPENFKAIIKLLANYNPILVTLSEKPKECIKYLSYQIQDQIITLIEN